MRCLLSLSLITFLLTVIISCSVGTTDGFVELKDVPSDISVADEEVEPVEVSIEQLVGTWKYAEVRTSTNQTGIAPVGEMLLGITKEFTLSFATEGLEELKANLVGVPSSFEIKNKQLCALDMSAEIDFKLNFKNTKVNCYLLNENEMILGKEKENSSMPVIYMYFTRIE